MSGELATLIARLEAATAKLEAISGGGRAGAGAAPSAPAAPAAAAYVVRGLQKDRVLFDIGKCVFVYTRFCRGWRWWKCGGAARSK